MVLVPWALWLSVPADACGNEVRAAIARAAPEERAAVLTRALEARAERERAEQARAEVAARREAAEAEAERRAELERAAIAAARARAEAEQRYAFVGVAFGIAGCVAFGTFTVLSFARDYAATYPARGRWIA